MQGLAEPGPGAGGPVVFGGEDSQCLVDDVVLEFTGLLVDGIAAVIFHEMS
jgi:hypothetical protein